MKRIFLTIVCLCLFFFYSNASNKKLYTHTCELDTLPTSQLITFLQQMNVESYYGKPVDSFLAAVPANLYNLKVYGGYDSQGALFMASKMPVYFTSDGAGPSAIIYVREFTHMNRYSSTFSWDVNLFRKEKIYKIDVYKDQNTCINGWCMEQQ